EQLVLAQHELLEILADQAIGATGTALPATVAAKPVGQDIALRSGGHLRYPHSVGCIRTKIEQNAKCVKRFCAWRLYLCSCSGESSTYSGYWRSGGDCRRASSRLRNLGSRGWERPCSAALRIRASDSDSMA